MHTGPAYGVAPRFIHVLGPVTVVAFVILRALLHVKLRLPVQTVITVEPHLHFVASVGAAIPKRHQHRPARTAPDRLVDQHVTAGTRLVLPLPLLVHVLEQPCAATERVRGVCLRRHLVLLVWPMAVVSPLGSASSHLSTSTLLALQVGLTSTVVAVRLGGYVSEYVYIPF